MKKIALLFMFPVLCWGQSLAVKTNELFKNKEFKKAERLILKHIAGNPNDFEAIELLGDTYGHQLNWDKAISYYKKLVDYDDQNANYHYKYGGALGMKALSVNKVKALGIIGDVKRSFLRAAELDREHIETRWALVELFMQLPGIIGGSKKRALKYSEELQNLSPVDGHLSKGYVYEYDEEPKLAEYHYKKALEIGGSITCFEKLAGFYEGQKRPSEAISTLEEAYEKHNRNALHYQLGKVSADYNIQLEKGERCLLKFIENHSPRDGVPIEWAYYRLAQIHKNKGDKNSAISWIDKALSVRGDFKQALEEKRLIENL